MTIILAVWLRDIKYCRDMKIEVFFAFADECHVELRPRGTLFATLGNLIRAAEFYREDFCS